MERIIRFETLSSYAYVNVVVCKMPIKGVVLSFFGLNGKNMYQNDTLEGEFYGSHGLLYVVPYTNPWAWMNSQAVGYTDEILDVLFSHFELPENTPVISTGGSMGGLSALVYCVYAKRTPAACVANCPVCDMEYHFTERPDLPRTIYSALWNTEGTLSDGLRSISPLHLAEKMPKIPYHIFHCGNDHSVNPEHHSEKMVEKMKNLGLSVTYDFVPDRAHCDLTYAMKKRFANYILQAVGETDSALAESE